MLEKVEEIGTITDGDGDAGGVVVELYSETCIDGLTWSDGKFY